MNKCIFSGRAASDPEIVYPENSDTCIANFTLAVSKENGTSLDALAKAPIRLP